MGRVLSIDLAYRRVRDLGVCLLEERKGKLAEVRFVDPEEVVNPEKESSLKRPLSAQECAEAISTFGLKNGVQVLLLDGPQGWKDPTSELKYCRYCERILNTPGKTGVYPHTKPGNWKDFAEYSVSVFGLLVHSGAKLVLTPIIEVPADHLLVAESFPAAAWQMLCLPPLPAQWRNKPAALEDRLKTLQRVYHFRWEGRVTHDGLQALVAGLAGVAILAGNASRYIAVGVPPKSCNGVTVEGFIVCPRLGLRGRK